MKISKSRAARFQRMIFAWWELHKRDLPWRRTRDPYHILISEVMLQQTQVLRVLPKYAEFIETYPTVNELAQASTADVLRIWKGMGYNRRALYLKKTAEAIVNVYHGEFPESEKELTKLPGLGRYTARALLVFAFEKNIAMVDTNIRQIIIHFFFKDLPQNDAIIQDVADQLVPVHRSWEWHQALMDYGAIALKRDRPERSRRTSVPFKNSNRYFRGKLVDMLRESGISERKARTMFSANVISSLIRDGLIIKRLGILYLPE